MACAGHKPHEQYEEELHINLTSAGQQQSKLPAPPTGICISKTPNMNNSTHHDASQYLIARYIELRGIPTAYRPGRPNSNHKEDPIPVKIKRVSVPGPINAIRTTSDIRFTRVDGTPILIKEVLRRDFEQLLVGAGDAVTSREVGKCIQLYMSVSILFVYVSYCEEAGD